MLVLLTEKIKTLIVKRAKNRKEIEGVITLAIKEVEQRKDLTMDSRVLFWEMLKDELVDKRKKKEEMFECLTTDSLDDLVGYAISLISKLQEENYKESGEK